MNKAFFFLLLLLVLPLATHAAECSNDSEGNVNKVLALKYKLIAVASILVAGAIGVSLPIVGKIFPSLSPENDFFFVVKAFAAGVIFATGCVHVLPDAFDNLTNPCLGDNPWGKFSFTGLAIMAAASATMLVEQVASILFKRMHFGKAKAVIDHDHDHEEMAGEHEGHVHVHTHATHGHAHGAACGGDDAQLLRHKVISQVLEIGIVVHSVIIGISLGASENPKTIKPLIAALSFHQLFEGMGLGGCISQAKLKATSVTIMSIFFSLTTPVGIAIGFAISNSYNENSPTALIVEGLFNAASAGILIYMALVDLIEADFKSARVLNNLKLLFMCDVTLLLGMGCMSLLAIWA